MQRRIFRRWLPGVAASGSRPGGSRGRCLFGAVSAIIPLLAGSITAAGLDIPQRYDDLIRQGRAAFLASDLDRAESAYNQACPADFVTTYPVAKAVTCENLLASVDEARGNPIRAEQRFLHAATGAEQAGPAYQPLYCAKLIDLGEHYHRQRQTAEAESTLLKAVDLARTLTAVKPELLPEALIRLGGLYSDSSQPERGLAPLTEALALISASRGGKGPTPPVTEIAYAHDRLGMIELTSGNPRDAESGIREAVALATAALGEDHPVTAAYQTNLALALIAEREFDRAALLLRRAEFVVQSQPGVPGSELAAICAEMSEAAAAEGKMAQAEDYAERAISILNLQTRPDPQAIASAQVTLAGVYLRNHDAASAEKILPSAVEIQREISVSPNTLAASVQLLGELRSQQRDWKTAAMLYREAIAIYERNSPADINPAVVPLLRALADVLKHEGGSKDEVRALESQVRGILRSVPRSVSSPGPPA